MTKTVGTGLPRRFRHRILAERARALPRIRAAIYVERESQKAIIIGKGGAKLKKIRSEARLDAQRLTGRKVYLQLFVKVAENWRNREWTLDELGISE